MSTALKQLRRVEQLFDESELDQALELLSDKDIFERLNPQQRCNAQFIKGLILLYQNKVIELIQWGEEMYKEGQRLNDNLQALDGLFFKIFGINRTLNFKEAHHLIKKAENLLNYLPDIPKRNKIRREARIYLLKGWTYLDDGNLDIGERYLEKTLNLAEELGNTFEIVWVNLLMSRLMYQVKHQFDLAIDYSKKALLVAKEVKFNHYWIAYCHIIFGLASYYFCEYNTSLKHRLKSLEVSRKIGNSWFIAWNINDIGVIYKILGDYDLAIKYFQESLSLRKEHEYKEVPLNNLIEAALEEDDIELARKYFNRLENLYHQKKEGFIYGSQTYTFVKALILKSSSRIRDIAKAEEILKQISESETGWPEVNINASIHLCDLLLAEYRLNNNEQVLDEVNHYLANLLTLAEKQHSYLVFCETFLLKAKLALLNFEIKTARRFLTQAQKIAESYGIKRLEMKISYEHDMLLKKSKFWEDLKESGASLSERWKFAGLNHQIENLVKKRMVMIPKLSKEEPVLLLIISKGGIPIFTHSFIKDKIFEEHLFGGFFTAFNSFMNEMFSEGFDRASFGEHTLLMKAIASFLICYIYKGQSYSAQNRIKVFIKELQEDKGVWETIGNCFSNNRIIQKDEIPSLDSMVNKIFLEEHLPKIDSV